jgi:Zn-dependent protease with chaperone function
VRPREIRVAAYAAGRRSVAVSVGLLDAYVDGRLTEQQSVAVLCHELAHLEAGATRHAIVLGWLTLLWRLAATPFRTLVHAIQRHIPFARAGVILVPVVVVVAVVRLANHGAWLAVVALAGLGWAVWIQPRIEAAARRTSEYAADARTSEVGLGLGLAQVLSRYGRSDCDDSVWRAGYPSVATRLRALSYRMQAPSPGDAAQVSVKQEVARLSR